MQRRKLGYSDLREESLRGQRFYLDQGSIKKRLLINRSGFFSRVAGSSTFETSSSEHLRTQDNSDFSYFLKDIWEKEEKTCPRQDPSEEETLNPPKDLIDMLKTHKDPAFAFRLTWERRDVQFSNNLGAHKHRSDWVRVLRIDYRTKQVHLRKFVYNPAVERAQKKIDSMKQVLLNLDRDRFEEVPTGVHSVVLDPTLSAVLAHEIFGHVAERIQSSWDWKYYQQMRIAPEINIKDLAHVPHTGVSYAFDDEGLTPQDIQVVNNGQFNEMIGTTETAFRLNRLPKGRSRAQDFRYRPLSRMANICLEAGQSSISELFSELNDGYYFMGALGGSLTENMFQIQAQHGYRIENGRPKSYVRGALMYGLLAQVLNTASVGNQLEWVSDGGCYAGGQFMDLSGRGGAAVLIRNIHIA